MPKNISGGNKTKKAKAKRKDVIIADELCDDQLYGRIQSKNGGGFFSVMCSDKVVRNGRLGTLLKDNRNPNARINIGTYVIVEMRECDTVKNKCIILTLANPPLHILNIFKTDDDLVNEDFFNNEDEEEQKCDDNVNVDFDGI